MLAEAGTVETVISICSAFVALMALGLSFWQGYLNRKHHRLSVTPHMIIDVDNRTTEKNAVYLRSNGLGPAVLKNLKWFVSDEEFDVSEINLVIEKANMGKFSPEFYEPDIGQYFAPNSRQFLIKVSHVDDQNHKAIRDAMSLISLSIEYESIYGEKFTTTFSWE